jgi:hypothetical protein
LERATELASAPSHRCRAISMSPHLIRIARCRLLAVVVLTAKTER